MFDSKIGLSGPQPEPSATDPTARVARIDLQRTLNQRDSSLDVLAKITKHEGRGGENLGVVPADSKRPAGKINALSVARLLVLAPAIHAKKLMAQSRQAQGGCVTRISRDRLPKQADRVEDLGLFRGQRFW
jgi:hypothetical protein